VQYPTALLSSILNEEREIIRVFPCQEFLLRRLIEAVRGRETVNPDPVNPAQQSAPVFAVTVEHPVDQRFDIGPFCVMKTRTRQADVSSTSENARANYVWHPKKNKSFVGQCHIETGKTWLQFEFDSDIGRIERPQDVQGNPMLISHDGKVVSLRGAVTILAEEKEQTGGTVTFTPQDEGFTDWHWTLTRDGQTYAEEGRGIFLRGDAKPRRSRAKIAPKKKAVPKKKAAPRKKIRKAKKTRLAATNKSRGCRR
jgi:hypothetical protein